MVTLPDLLHDRYNPTAPWLELRKPWEDQGLLACSTSQNRRRIVLVSMMNRFGKFPRSDGKRVVGTSMNSKIKHNQKSVKVQATTGLWELAIVSWIAMGVLAVRMIDSTTQQFRQATLPIFIVIHDIPLLHTPTYFVRFPIRHFTQFPDHGPELGAHDAFVPG